MSTLKLILALALLITFNAGATPFSPFFDADPNGIPTPRDDNDPPGSPDFDLNDAVNLLLGTSFANNVDIDHLQIPTTADNAWLSPSGGGILALIGLTAGFSNGLGIYTDLGGGALKSPIVLGPFSGLGFDGDGTASNPFRGISAVPGLFPPTPFGFYLESDNGTTTTTYFSEPTLNPDGFEHMVAYNLSDLSGSVVSIDFFGVGTLPYTFTSPVLVGWEDLRSDVPIEGLLADDDFDDMMYIFDAVAPIRTDSSGSTVVFLTLAMAGLAAGLRKMKRLDS